MKKSIIFVVLILCLNIPLFAQPTEIYIPDYSPSVPIEWYKRDTARLKKLFMPSNDDNSLIYNKYRNIATFYTNIGGHIDTIYRYLNLSYNANKVSFCKNEKSRTQIMKYSKNGKWLGYLDEQRYNEFMEKNCNHILDSLNNAENEKKLAETKSIYLNQNLRERLENIRENDQKNRHMMDSIRYYYGEESHEMKTIWKKQHQLDSINLHEIEGIIAKYGYIGKSLVGEDLSSTAFLVLQHSNVKKLEQYFLIVKQAVLSKELSKSSFKLYVDRMLMWQDKKQLFGTQQIFDKEKNTMVLAPLEEKNMIPIRLKELGLDSIYTNTDY